jgi:hypothetical protein
MVVIRRVNAQRDTVPCITRGPMSCEHLRLSDLNNDNKPIKFWVGSINSLCLIYITCILNITYRNVAILLSKLESVYWYSDSNLVCFQWYIYNYFIQWYMHCFSVTTHWFGQWEYPLLNQNHWKIVNSHWWHSNLQKKTSQILL